MNADTVDMESALRTAGAARARYAATNDACATFFTGYADEIARACRAMASRFHAGGRLLVHAADGRSSDVAHAVVEFMHPVVVGKRALPAIRIASESLLQVMGRDDDILMVLTSGAPSDAERSLLARASARNMLTVSLVGLPAAPDRHVSEHHRFVVASDDACIVQEIHEMLYHVLWELVHVFLDHGEVSG